MAFWLDLFTIETWHEFKNAGADVSGFRESRWSRTAQIAPDDRLLLSAPCGGQLSLPAQMQGWVVIR